MRYVLNDAMVKSYSTHGSSGQQDILKLKHALTTTGVSPIGAQQALLGQTVTSQPDRAVLAALLAQVCGGAMSVGGAASSTTQSSSK